MENKLDNGLYFDGHDIVNSFMWGIFVGALIAGAAFSIIFGPFSF